MDPFFLNFFITFDPDPKFYKKRWKIKNLYKDNTRPFLYVKDGNVRENGGFQHTKGFVIKSTVYNIV